MNEWDLPGDPDVVDVRDEGIALRRAQVTWASAIEAKPVTWAWKDADGGRLPAGALALAAGREGTGKSSYGLWLAAQVTRGTLPGSFSGTPRRVLYVALEDSWEHTLVPRMMAADADLDMVGRFEILSFLDEEMALSLPHDNVLFEQTITEHNVALVVIDPLLSTIGEGIDSHRNREVRRALDPLVKIASMTGAVILGIAHHGKSQSADASSLIVGSGAFKDVPRAIFSFAQDPSDENGGLVMSQSKNSLGKIGSSMTYCIESVDVATPTGLANVGRFRITGVSNKSVDDLLREGRGGGDQDDRHEVQTWLVDYLAANGGESAAKDVLRAGLAEGYSRDSLKRAKGRQVISEKAGFGGGWVWRLQVGDGEESTEGSEESRLLNPAPFAPLALSSVPDAARSQSVDKEKRAHRTRHLTVAARGSVPAVADSSARESLANGCDECGGVAGHVSTCSRRGAS